MNFWFIFLIIIVVLLVLTAFILLKRVNKLDDSVDKLKEKIRYYNRNISELEIKLKNLSPTLVNNNQIKTNIQKEVVVSKELSLGEKKSEPIEMTIPRVVIQHDDVFFMPAPSSEGGFDINNESRKFRETVTLYKFIIHKNNSNKADFEFHSDEIGIKNAVNYPNRYLESVCSINSAHNPNTKKIITERNGTADKIGDKWVVNSNNKAQIKYE
jgi:hypothetical protein